MIISPLFAHEKSSISKKSITSLLTVFKMNQEDMLNDYMESSYNVYDLILLQRVRVI